MLAYGIAGFGLGQSQSCKRARKQNELQHLLFAFWGSLTDSLNPYAWSFVRAVPSKRELLRPSGPHMHTHTHIVEAHFSLILYKESSKMR